MLCGIEAEGRRAGRAGYLVYAADRASSGSGAGDSAVGVVTSGALSPTLGYPIAMVYVAPEFAAADTALEIDVRGTRVPATVVPLPFYQRESR